MDRLEYFDSFRGLLCISVILRHQHFETYTLNGFHLGVIGFFILSSFLLTYRLIKQYESAQSINNIARITINYAIMRFFRIYIPFVIYCFIDRYYLKCDIKQTTTMFKCIKLNYLYRAIHLWTMPIEIRYYFLIPFISILFSRVYKLKLLVWSLFLVKLFYLAKIKQYKWVKMYEDNQINELSGYLPIFLAGSILAGLYANLEETKWIEKLSNSRIYNYILTILSLIVFVLIARSHAQYKTVRDDAYLYSAGITIFMFLLLVSPSNLIAKYLSSEFMLKSIGKYSYGTYLFHKTVIRNNFIIITFKNYLKISTDLCLATIFISFCYGFLFSHLVENNSISIAKILIKKVNGRLPSILKK